MKKDIPSPEIVDTEAAYWLGYLIAYWHIVEKYDFAKLSEENCRWLFDNYDSLHTQSCEYVYDLFLEEKTMSMSKIVDVCNTKSPCLI